MLPAGVAYVGALIVDAVVARDARSGGGARHVLELVLLEGVLVAAHLRRAARHLSCASRCCARSSGSASTS